MKGVPVSVEVIEKEFEPPNYLFLRNHLGGTMLGDIYSCLCFFFTSGLVSSYTILCCRLANMQMVAGVLVSLTQKFSTAIVINGMEPAM